MILVTSDNIPGYEIEKVIRIVIGNTVMSKHLGRDIAASFKTLAGGEIKGYTEMLTEARNIAIQRMIDEAEKINADAIICFRLGSSSVMSGSAEMVAYGTAVKVKKTE